MKHLATWPPGAPRESSLDQAVVTWELVASGFVCLLPHDLSPSPIPQRNPWVESFPEVVIFLNDVLMVLHTDLTAFGGCTFLGPQPFSLGLRGTGEDCPEALSSASPATSSLMETLFSFLS